MNTKSFGLLFLLFHFNNISCKKWDNTQYSKYWNRKVCIRTKKTKIENHNKTNKKEKVIFIIFDIIIEY